LEWRWREWASPPGFSEGIEIDDPGPHPSCLVKELIQALRDKRMRMTLIIPPIIQLIIFGYAANLDVKHIRTAVRISIRASIRET